MTTPLLSVVLATDTHDTVRAVVAALQCQRICDRMELVIVLPAHARDGAARQDLRAFANVQVVPWDPAVSLAAARAAGVRAASAPVVFIGETHTYPEPDWAEALLAPFGKSWSAVVPGIGNANPSGAVSWAAYLFDYATWGENRPAGEITDPLTYNTAYRRPILLALGDRLGEALDPAYEALWPRLRADGHRVWFAPEARIGHLNVARPWALVQEKFCAGAVLGMRRASRWPWHRRVLYVLASPLIPVVLLWRLANGVRPSLPRTLPAGTIPAMILAALAKTAGEVVGYIGLTRSPMEARLADIEIRKVRYAQRRMS